MALLLGTLAAVVWGLHDTLVRVLSPRGAAMPLLFIALLAGAALLAPVALVSERGVRLTSDILALAVVAGVVHALSTASLYRAFSIGPVRVVAPLCGSFPIVSLGIAAAQGRPVAGWEWLAVVAVIGGMALAGSRIQSEAAGPRGSAVAWALLASLGFAVAIGLAHLAAAGGGELTVTLAGRVAAVLCVGLYLLLAWVPVRLALSQWRPLALMGTLDVIGITSVIAAARFPFPEYAAIASSLFGLVTVLLAWSVLREPMRPLQWLGVGVVFGAIALIAS